MREPMGRGLLLGVGALLLLDALGARLGIVPDLALRLPGASAWVLSRALGLTAYAALTLDVCLGLLVSGGTLDRWVARVRLLEAHRWLSGVSLALLAAHALVLLLDGFAGFDALDVVVPFVAPLRPLAVGLGILAGYALFVVRESFEWRPRIGVRVWRALHSASYVAFALATAHGLLAGTDASRSWALASYGLACAVVGALTFVRFRGLLARVAA